MGAVPALCERRALRWVVGVPAGAVEERRRERVDEVVCADAEGSHLAEARQVFWARVETRGWNAEGRVFRRQGAIVVLQAHAWRLVRLAGLLGRALAHADAAEEALGIGGHTSLGRADRESRYLEACARGGGPAGADLGLEIGDEDVSKEGVASGVGEDGSA